MMGQRREVVAMVYGSEKPSTRRTRIIVSVIVWAVLIPVFVFLWMDMAWWTLLPIGLAAWGTWGYIKRGGWAHMADEGYWGT